MNSATKNLSIDRVYFLDTMRYYMVLLVLPLHVSLSYIPELNIAALVPDTQHGPLNAIIYIILDSFPMEILFFIAGYFAISSFQKKGLYPFIKNKIKRLGIPYIIVVFFQLPILGYVYDYTRSVTDNSLWKIWKNLFINFFTPYLGIIDFKKHFHPMVFWFLTVLLFFFIVFGVIYQIKNKWLKTNIVDLDKGKQKSILVVMLIFGILSSIGFFLAEFICPDIHWFSLGNILVFRPTRTVIYISFFALGIYAYSNKWFNGKPFPGKIWIYTVSSIVLLFSLLPILMQIYMMKSSSLIVQLMHGCIRSFFCLSILCLLTSILYRYRNQFSKVRQKLAENSYNIYLIHFSIIVPFQFLMLQIPIIPGYIKFVVITVLSTGICFFISNYIIRPYPKVFVVSIILLFFIMLLIL